MPRIARLVMKGEKTVYHVMSRTALEGYVLEDVEKDFLLRHIRWLAKVYFAEALGFCIMGNHFHLLVRMAPGAAKPIEEIRFRYRTRYFTVSGFIGTKEFVGRVYQEFKGHFGSKHEKRPRAIQGLNGVFSLKRLSENIV